MTSFDVTGITQRTVAGIGDLVHRIVRALLRPASASILVTAVLDLSRSKADLIAENALLRHQLALLKRQSGRPKLSQSDRLHLLLLLAKITRTWRLVLMIVLPATLLRWHRKGFRLFWKWKSQKHGRPTRTPAATIALIRRMAAENPLWGSERIRGELLKLDIKVAKRTIQKYLDQRPIHRQTSQKWSTFLKTHGADIWTCDFVPVVDLLFRQIYVFFIVALQSRRVVHFGVTRSPHEIWAAQQFKEATAGGRGPRWIIRDNDCKYGSAFDIVAEASGTEVIRTPFRSPLANSVCERFIGSARRECLDHMLIFGERQLQRIVQAFVDYFNRSRPHQGIGQGIPCGPPVQGTGEIISVPVLNGLHHEYRRAA